MLAVVIRGVLVPVVVRILRRRRGALMNLIQTVNGMPRRFCMVEEKTKEDGQRKEERI